ELDAETQQSWPVDQPVAEGEELAEEAADDEELGEDDPYVAEDGALPAEDAPADEAVEGEAEPPQDEQ
ncbi:MAG TPA: hypothetical protein VJN67_10650, partial [Stellaceae bacterium]|nr:hypothetical protein [Stellaceae bacterium]